MRILHEILKNKIAGGTCKFWASTESLLCVPEDILADHGGPLLQNICSGAMSRLECSGA
jgi:hypothetical protein